MGDVCALCWAATDDGLDAAEKTWDPIFVRLRPQNHVYTVSRPISQPVVAGYAEDGSVWTRHLAHVLDDVTVSRPVRDE